VPVLEKYLKTPLSNDEVFTETVADALYLITGKSYQYKDYDGVQKLYQPRPLTEEEYRKRARPDLKAAAGLIAFLEIADHDPSGVAWIENRPLNTNSLLQIRVSAPSKSMLPKTISFFRRWQVMGSEESRRRPYCFHPSKRRGSGGFIAGSETKPNVGSETKGFTVIPWLDWLCER
jgi:hypothetical protein